MTATVLLIALTLTTLGFTRAKHTDRDWQTTAQYRGQLAHKYRAQRDHLQHLLRARVLDVQALRWKLKVLTHTRHRYPLHRADSLEAIRLASIAYHVDQGQMMSIASCETGGTYNRYSKNPSSSASGLFQFLTGTFAGTPYGRESIWSPYANALAAAWMISNGRRHEWVC